MSIQPSGAWRRPGLCVFVLVAACSTPPGSSDSGPPTDAHATDHASPPADTVTSDDVTGADDAASGDDAVAMDDPVEPPDDGVVPPMDASMGHDAGMRMDAGRDAATPHDAATDAGGSTDAGAGTDAGGSSTCTVTVTSVAAAASAARTAAAGSTICIAAGTYGRLDVSAAPSGNVIIQAVPGAHVALGGVNVGASGRNLTIHGFWITDEVDVTAGASYIVIDHNDITGGYYGINMGSVDCSAPNAPVYPGCTSYPVVSHITISGNRLHNFDRSDTEDALHFNHFDQILVTGNEITRTVETGNHADCLQSVWGGSNLVFTRNYEHDNQCQSFFLKDGDVTNVTVSDNLFVRGRVGGLDESSLQVFNTQNLVVENNTDWAGLGEVLRADDSVVSPTARFDHNVMNVLSVINDSGTHYALDESWDVFGTAPWSITPGPHSTVVASPMFMDTASDDYRLVTNPNHIGVDWRPADQHYGP